MLIFFYRVAHIILVNVTDVHYKYFFSYYVFPVFLCCTSTPIRENDTDHPV